MLFEILLSVVVCNPSLTACSAQENDSWMGYTGSQKEIAMRECEAERLAVEQKKSVLKAACFVLEAGE